MASITRNELAVAIAGGRNVREITSHSRIEDANKKQICYVQGRSLICKVDTLPAATLKNPLVKTPGYNRAVFQLIAGDAKNIAAAKKLVEQAAKGHDAKIAKRVAPAAKKAVAPAKPKRVRKPKAVAPEAAA